MVGGERGVGGGDRGVRMVGHPPLAQSTFDNMGAEASALRESLVIVRKRQCGIICKSYQVLEEEVRFTVNGKEVVVGKEVGPQVRLARCQR